MGNKNIAFKGIYVTTCLKCDDLETLLQFCNCYRYVLGPKEFEGYFYAYIKTRNGIKLVEGIKEIDPSEALDILGVWE